MAENSSTHPELSPQKVSLHIVSPAVEVPRKLTFTDLPASTTILELKEKIQDAIPTKPSPEYQRLIFKGKALTRNDEQLSNVIGLIAVCLQ
jgi:Ubiquitin family